MLCSAKDLKKFAIVGRDGELGMVDDLLFDDENWVVRHLVVDTGGWLAGHSVLLSPHAVQQVDREGRKLHVDLTREQVENAPALPADQAVSRQHELALYDYYGYPFYWSGPFTWGTAAFPMPQEGSAGPVGGATPPQRKGGDPHLRSCADVTGYRIEATDGSIGHVHDFLFEPQAWQVREMVVDTRNWLPGKHVLVAPGDIEAVNWGDRHVRVGMSREGVKHAPGEESVRVQGSH